MQINLTTKDHKDAQKGAQRNTRRFENESDEDKLDLHLSFRPQNRPGHGACGTQGCVFLFLCALCVLCGKKLRRAALSSCPSWFKCR